MRFKNVSHVRIHFLGVAIMVFGKFQVLNRLGLNKKFCLKITSRPHKGFQKVYFFQVSGLGRRHQPDRE